MHLKRLEDAARDDYQNKIRAMTTAALNKNTEVNDEKKSSEAHWKNYEAQTDKNDLAKMNASALNPSATLTQGPKWWVELLHT